MKFNSLFFLPLALSVVTHPAFAQMTEGPEDCDPETQNCTEEGEVRDANETIYPYKPFSTTHLKERLTALNEGTNYISNVFEMEKKGLNYASTSIQPWGGPYWPLYQGMVGNTYQDKDYKTFILTLASNLDWKKNVNDYKKRAERVHPKIYELSEDELSKLSPSEKYDILLGDTSFDLTNRIWDYAEKWGNEKKWGFLSAIDIPEGYVIPKANKYMALWEGICHGWAVAAGHSPRPKKTVNVTLPNGKRMPFYPNDIKALISLMWANSTIQSNVIFEGNRCNRRYPDRDKYGRYIDVKKDRDDQSLIPRCADVHPGIFHVSMVNILGLEGRSFIVDKTAEAAVANQPVSGYYLSYFNPKTGRRGPLYTSVLSRASYGDKDPFKESRNPDSTHIVGVDVTLNYVDWEFPKKASRNSALNDKIKGFSFTYDLELDQQGNVVGGQWRVNRKVNRKNILTAKTHQPDFFWVVPRDYKTYFKPVSTLPEWDFKESTLPPQEFGPAAKGAHSFIYEESERYFGVSPKCPVFPVGGGDPLQVKCAFRYPKPQPLINVVETLLNESRRGL
jgi:hypothetical protein